jgi:hypothetical protein
MQNDKTALNTPQRNKNKQGKREHNTRTPDRTVGAAKE